MTDTFPRQYARTRRFTLGAPRSFEISPDGAVVAFLRSRHGGDPVTCLWALDVGTGLERLIADPAQLGVSGTDLDQQERARRERAREQASGIVAFATDAEFRSAVFGLSGRVYLADLTGGGDPDRAGGAHKDLAGSAGTGQPGGPAVRELAVRAPAADPRLAPSGDLVSYVSGGALRTIDVRTGADRAVADPGPAAGIFFGLAEFVAAEEMGRPRGYWWAPDSAALLVARVDENPVQRWYIADPANPDRRAAEVRYPAAGTPNARVDLFLARLDGAAGDTTAGDTTAGDTTAGGTPAGDAQTADEDERGPAALTRIDWDQAAFPYLVTVCWEDPAARQPLAVVQSRDHRRMRILAVDPASGAATVARDDAGEPWLEITPGVPAWTAGGAIVWTTDDDDTRRLLVASPRELADRTARPVTPAGLQVRQVLSVDGDTVLFAASQADPTEIGLWTFGPDGLKRAAASEADPQVQAGRRAGGTTVAASRSLRQDDATFRVLRSGGERARIGSHAERPLLPSPAPEIFPAGDLEVRTALLLPSWHRPGSAVLPVLMCPYGGPHGQQVVASRSAFLTAQWFAEQGFAVVVADGRGTPGRGLAWEHAVAGDLAGPPLEDQVTALQAAAGRCADLDLARVAIRGWSFGGFLSALAVLRRPDVFHAAVAGAPVTQWSLYDTHYTERYLGQPGERPDAYERSSLLTDARRLSRPLLIIHGLADDNVVVAHSLRLSAALLAAGRPHRVLPLSGVTHLASQEEVAENLLLLQVDFLRDALGIAPRDALDAAVRGARGSPPPGGTVS
jgi:dipeptidyl-peptidase-4